MKRHVIRRVTPHGHCSVIGDIHDLNYQIISSVGGHIVFILALVGLVLLSVDFRIQDRRLLMQRKVLILFAIIWFLSVPPLLRFLI